MYISAISLAHPPRNCRTSHVPFLLSSSKLAFPKSFIARGTRHIRHSQLLAHAASGCALCSFPSQFLITCPTNSSPHPNPGCPPVPSPLNFHAIIAPKTFPQTVPLFQPLHNHNSLFAGGRSPALYTASRLPKQVICPAAPTRTCLKCEFEIRECAGRLLEGLGQPIDCIRGVEEGWVLWYWWWWVVVWWAGD